MEARRPRLLRKPSRAFRRAGCFVACAFVYRNLGNASVPAWELEGKRSLRGSRSSEDKVELREPDHLHLVSGGLIEFRERHSIPWHTAQNFVPAFPEVAKWWREEQLSQLFANLAPCPSGEPHYHLHVFGTETFPVGNTRAHGVHEEVHLPAGALPQTCRLEWVTTKIDHNRNLEPARVLRIVCAVAPLVGDPRTRLGSMSNRVAATLFRLVLPLIKSSRALPILVSIFASAFSTTCLIMVAMIYAKAYFIRWMRRRRRLWQFQALRRNATVVEWAFSEDQPCCICLSDLTPAADRLCVLLPCRHVLHQSCYTEWISTGAYSSSNLRCPLCSQNLTAVGQLAS